MPLTYPGPPAISLTALGQQQAIAGAAPLKTYGLVGTASQGSDHACVVSFQDALNFWGNPSNVKSQGYTLPLAVTLLASAAQQAGVQAFNVAMMRVGIVNATATIATGTILTATGLYAGTRGANLSVTVTVTASIVTAIAITDTVLTTTVQSYVAAPTGPDDLSSLTAIANTINGRNPINNPNSVVRVTTVGSALPTVTATVPFAGTPNDGLGTAATSATIDTILAESLAYQIDYITPLWDWAAVSPKIATHAAAANAALKFRKFVGAPSSAITFAAATSTVSAYVPTLSDLYNVWGIPPVKLIDPILGVPTIKDPFFGAVSAGGLKASGPTEETMDGSPLPGIVGFSDWSDHSGTLAPADLIALGAAGLATAGGLPGKVGVYVIDNITTAPYSINGASVNAFYQFSIRDQDHEVSKAAVAAAQGFSGRPGTGNATTANNIATAIDTALSALGFLVKHTTTCVVNQSTLAYDVDIAYIPQYPILNIPITTHFSFS